MKKLISVFLASLMLVTAVFAADDDYLVLQDQGTFTAGGTVTTEPGEWDPLDPTNPQGQTTHHGHASVFYQIPADYNGHDIVFLHGVTQSRVCWQTTADGRDGFDRIFLDNGYGVYLSDQPGRGEAGWTANPAEENSVGQEQHMFGQFRYGVWPDFYPGILVPQTEEYMDQFFRQMTPDTGSYSTYEIGSAIAAILEKTGPAILMTHSAGGPMGWEAAMQSDNVEAIVALEPGSFPFPEGMMPEPIENVYMPNYQGWKVSMDDFSKLLDMPIIMYYGDYIPSEPSQNAGEDFWRANLELAHIFCDTVNELGGDCTLVVLPEIGIHGNSHFLQSDLNNQEIAGLILDWLRENNLD